MHCVGIAERLARAAGEVHHWGVSARNIQSRRFGYRLTHDGTYCEARPLIVSAPTLFLRVSRQLPVNATVDLEWAGPGGIRLEGTCQQIGAQAPDGWFTCEIRLCRVAARESQHALQWFLQTELNFETSLRPESEGAFWAIALDGVEDASKKQQAPVRTGPAVKIAGQSANTPHVPPLKTGYGPTSTDDILQLLEKYESKVGVYLNVPCAYIVAGASYWGRALRLNERWLQINTNAVVPGLGVRIRSDVTLEIDGVKRAVSVHGVMSRKKELPSGGAYKATVALMIRDIDEGDSPGLFRLWLEKHLDARRTADGQK